MGLQRVLRHTIQTKTVVKPMHVSRCVIIMCKAYEHAIYPKYVNHDKSQYLVLNIQITAVYYVLKARCILISCHNLKELKHDSLKSNRVLSE